MATVDRRPRLNPIDDASRIIGKVLGVRTANWRDPRAPEARPGGALSAIALRWPCRRRRGRAQGHRGSTRRRARAHAPQRYRAGVCRCVSLGADRGVAGAPPVIAGFGGGLISHAYIEECVLPGIDRAQLAAFERHLARWWQRTSRSLGPASGTRAVFDVAVAPLLELLGHDRPAGTPAPEGLVAWLPPDSLLIAIPWSE